MEDLKMDSKWIELYNAAKAVKNDIEIMLDYDTERVVTLGELTSEWWI